MTKHSEWKWFGDVGHFIYGQWCRFHLTTQVGGYLVSTVGRYVPPRHSGSNERTEGEWLREHPNGEELGYKRYYETMVFRAGKPCAADGCACGLPEIGSYRLDFTGYNSAADANAGHLALCEKWAKE